MCPNSSLRTAHLHPTSRYKNRPDQAEFESPFEFVKDKTLDTLIMTLTVLCKVRAAKGEVYQADVTQQMLFCSNFSKSPCKWALFFFLTVTGALWCLFLCACVKSDACVWCGLRSRNTLHYSFGWQSRGPYPLALPHHSTGLQQQQQAVCMPDLDTMRSAGGLSAYQHMGQDIWVHIYIYVLSFNTSHLLTWMKGVMMLS